MPWVILKKMAQSLANVLIHLIFSTQGRRPFIHPNIAPHLYAYMVGSARQYNVMVYEIGGIEDHIHLLFSLPRTLSLSKCVEEIKKGSSKWMKTQGDCYQDFAWQNGYGAFSIGQSNVDALRAYIQNQKQHHQRLSFQDELRQFLEKYKVKFDEKYIWD